MRRTCDGRFRVPGELRPRGLPGGRGDGRRGGADHPRGRAARAAGRAGRAAPRGAVGAARGVHPAGGGSAGGRGAGAGRGDRPRPARAHRATRQLRGPRAGPPDADRVGLLPRLRPPPSRSPRRFGRGGRRLAADRPAAGAGVRPRPHPRRRTGTGAGQAGVHPAGHHLRGRDVHDHRAARRLRNGLGRAAARGQLPPQGPVGARIRGGHRADHRGRRDAGGPRARLYRAGDARLLHPALLRPAREEAAG